MNPHARIAIVGLAFGFAAMPAAPAKAQDALGRGDVLDANLNRLTGTRNAVAATVTDLVPHGGLVTVRAGWLSAEVTPAAVSDLSLAPGERVHFVVKAAEVAIYRR